MEQPSTERIKQVDAMLGARDSLMADYISKVIRQKGQNRKVLVVMNYRHAYDPDCRRTPGQKADNAARYIFEAFPGRCANVMINGVKPMPKLRWPPCKTVSGTRRLPLRVPTT